LRFPAIAGVLCLFCASSAVAWGQQRVDFRADVELVLLHVAVIDPRGGHIPTLTQEDFHIYDDGARQTIELFATPSDAPLDIGLVLDFSGSMAPVEIAARRAALTFLTRLSAEDCVYALPFTDVIDPGRWGKAADPELRLFINNVTASGGTALYDAMLAGMAELERVEAEDLVGNVVAEARGADESEPPAEAEVRVEEQPPVTTRNVQAEESRPPVELPPRRPSLLSDVGSVVRDLDLHTPPSIRGCGEPLPGGARYDPSNARRRALLVLSDGADKNSDASFYEVLQAARSASVPVFPVAMGYARDDPKLMGNLEELARATGGRLITETAPGRVGEAYDEVVTLLRSFYLIGYDPGFDRNDPTEEGRWHDVRVELRRPNFEPLVRPGYYR
jgi:hypothetical protein